MDLEETIDYLAEELALERTNTFATSVILPAVIT